MESKMSSVFSVLLLLSGSWQGGHAGGSPPAEGPTPWTPQPAGWDRPSAEATSTDPAERTVQTRTVTEPGSKTHLYSSNSTDLSELTNTFIVPAQTHSAAADVLSSTSPFTPPLKTPSTEGSAPGSLPTFSSPTVQDPGSKASSTQLQSESPPAASTRQTPAPGRTPAGPPHQELPSELNVGDEELKGSQHRSSSLDPLLAALLSVFIITTAIVFIALFFKFRQRTSHPEFHRLQDLPMDDLMEDTPLSMYTH